MLEMKTLELLTNKQLKAFKHRFLAVHRYYERKKVLEKLIKQKKAPWL